MCIVTTFERSDQVGLYNCTNSASCEITGVESNGDESSWFAVAFDECVCRKGR